MKRLANYLYLLVFLSLVGLPGCGSTSPRLTEAEVGEAIAVLSAGCASAPARSEGEIAAGVEALHQASAVMDPERGGPDCRFVTPASSVAEIEACLPEAGIEAEAPAPLLTLDRGTPVYYRIGFTGTCQRVASGGPPSPWSITGGAFNGALLPWVPGVCEALRGWNSIGCGATNPDRREVCVQHAPTVWRWNCERRRWELGGGDCGGPSILAAFERQFGRPWVSGLHEEGLAAQSCCGTCIPACLGGPGCPGPRPTAPPAPDPCAPPPPVCGLRGCEAGETCESCPADCGPCPDPCGDGQCIVPEDFESCSVDCPPPDPGPVRVRLAVEPDGAGAWVVWHEVGGVTGRSPVLSRGDMQLSTGRLDLVLTVPERTICPPPTCTGCPPRCAECPRPPPSCEDCAALDCDEPDPDPAWELLHQAPAGWSWTAGSNVPAPVLSLDVANRGAFGGLRVSYDVIPNWPGCVELPGPMPSPKCLGTYITADGSAAQVFSYLMAERASLTLRHGFIPGWSPDLKPKTTGAFRLEQGKRYAVLHEIADGRSRVTITPEGGAAWTLIGADTCVPAPCFPATFTARTIQVKAGWRGDEADTGGTMGWRLENLRVEVKR